VLANFYYKGEKYVVATPLEPVLIIGSPTGKGAEVKSELRVSNDMQTISSLPGASGLQGALEVRVYACSRLRGGCECMIERGYNVEMLAM
jgi:hypothetical protein